MCLTSIQKRLAKDYEGQTHGWKVFNGPTPRSKFYDSGELPIGEWLNEEDYRPGKAGVKYIYDDYPTHVRYPFGWHTYLNKDDAVSKARWGIGWVCQVWFRNPVAWGLQTRGEHVVVAKQIYISEAARD